MLITYFNDENNSELPDTGRDVFLICCCVLLAIIVILCMTPALAADKSSLSSAKATYQSDRAMCKSGQTNQDQATCLKEAAAAYDEARRGRLNDGQAQYNQNSLDRCNALPPEDIKACQRRIMGEGTTEGSVEEGGIYRRIETPVVMPMPSQSPSPIQNKQNRY